MTEIMPVPRNSHITVLRPPSVSDGAFAIGPGPDGLLSAGPPLSLAQVNEIVRHLLGE